MSLVFSEVAEISLVAAPLGQFQQLLKTRVILILNFTQLLRLPIKQSLLFDRVNFFSIKCFLFYEVTTKLRKIRHIYQRREKEMFLPRTSTAAPVIKPTSTHFQVSPQSIW